MLVETVLFGTLDAVDPFAVKIGIVNFIKKNTSKAFSNSFRKKTMLTATAPSSDLVSTLNNATQNETNLSDVEILRRVRNIRSGWSASERMERRQAAGERFAALLQALELDTHAA